MANSSCSGWLSLALAQPRPRLWASLKLAAKIAPASRRLAATLLRRARSSGPQRAAMAAVMTPAGHRCIIATNCRVAFSTSSRAGRRRCQAGRAMSTSKAATPNRYRTEKNSALCLFNQIVSGVSPNSLRRSVTLVFRGPVYENPLGGASVRPCCRCDNRMQDSDLASRGHCMGSATARYSAVNPAARCSTKTENSRCGVTGCEGLHTAQCVLYCLARRPALWSPAVLLP